MSYPNEAKAAGAANERTSLLASSSSSSLIRAHRPLAVATAQAHALAAAPPAYSIDVDPAPAPAPQPSSCVYSLPARSTYDDRLPFPSLRATTPSSPRYPSGPSPLLSLPPPVLVSRTLHFREADRRARRRLLHALVAAFVICVVWVNLVEAPELEGARRELRKSGHRAWKAIKKAVRKVGEWEKEHGVGDGIGKARFCCCLLRGALQLTSAYTCRLSTRPGEEARKAPPLPLTGTA